MLSAWLLGCEAAAAAPAELVEIWGESRYPDHATNLFASFTPCTHRAGGEMSGLIAHFLFAANLGAVYGLGLGFELG
jgi:hypothetical protein